VSHPWKAQPYYLMHQARTSAPVPAPMGLSGYTRGSFTPKSPWATPNYIAAPDGVDGFGAFGASSDCVSFEALEARVLSALQSVAAQIGLSGLFDDVSDFVEDGAKAAGGALAKELLPALAKLIAEKIRDASAKIQDLTGSLDGLLISVVGDAVEATGEPLSTFAKPAIPALVKVLREQLFDIVAVCQPSTWSPPEVLQPVGILSASQMSELRRRMDRVAATRGTGLSRTFAPIVPLRLINPVRAGGSAAGGGGISPIMIGAAALAALMLFK